MCPTDKAVSSEGVLGSLIDLKRTLASRMAMPGGLDAVADALLPTTATHPGGDTANHLPNSPADAPGTHSSGGNDQFANMLLSNDFKMYAFKVLPCPRRYGHAWALCPFSHQGEKARRRDVRVYQYAGVACPDMKKYNSCARGDACSYSHNDFEYWLHPQRYRTQLCKEGPRCRRKTCFFAHHPTELRAPTPIIPPTAILDMLPGASTTSSSRSSTVGGSTAAAAPAAATNVTSSPGAAVGAATAVAGASVASSPTAATAAAAAADGDALATSAGEATAAGGESAAAPDGSEQLPAASNQEPASVHSPRADSSSEATAAATRSAEQQRPEGGATAAAFALPADGQMVNDPALTLPAGLDSSNSSAPVLEQQPEAGSAALTAALTGQLDQLQLSAAPLNAAGQGQQQGEGLIAALSSLEGDLVLVHPDNARLWHLLAEQQQQQAAARAARGGSGPGGSRHTHQLNPQQQQQGKGLRRAGAAAVGVFPYQQQQQQQSQQHQQPRFPFHQQQQQQQQQALLLAQQQQMGMGQFAGRMANHHQQQQLQLQQPAMALGGWRLAAADGQMVGAIHGTASSATQQYNLAVQGLMVQQHLRASEPQLLGPMGLNAPQDIGGYALQHPGGFGPTAALLPNTSGAQVAAAGRQLGAYMLVPGSNLGTGFDHAGLVAGHMFPQQQQQQSAQQYVVVPSGQHGMAAAAAASQAVSGWGVGDMAGLSMAAPTTGALPAWPLTQAPLAPPQDSLVMSQPLLASPAQQLYTAVPSQAVQQVQPSHQQQLLLGVPGTSVAATAGFGAGAPGSGWL